jgi:hypothetical protein
MDTHHDASAARQLHEIDDLLPNRPAGNLLVYCGMYPEQGINRIEAYQTLPKHLK